MACIVASTWSYCHLKRARVAACQFPIGIVAELSLIIFFLRGGLGNASFQPDKTSCKRFVIPFSLSLCDISSPARWRETTWREAGGLRADSARGQHAWRSRDVSSFAVLRSYDRPCGVKTIVEISSPCCKCGVDKTMTER